MNYFQKELSGTDSEPYSGDLLNREHSGHLLELLVSSFPGGFVLAINGKWGTGKTTFVKMWERQMKKAKYKTLYFNAWEMDHIEDPLIGLIAEFKKMVEKKGEKQVKKFANVIRKVSFSIVPSVLALASKTYTGLDIKDVVKEGSKEAIDILNDCVDNYLEQKKSIKEFKDELAKYVKEFSPQRPIIFIIDELDRCKPDFAVKTLERIKHLFAVENIVFVLAIDRVQLGNSIRGYYGSDLIDANDYLRRFIDIQYDLTTGDVTNLVDSIFNRLGFYNSFYLNRVAHSKNLESIEVLIEFVVMMYSNNNMSIRKLEKWLLHTRLVMDQIMESHLSFETISFLVYLHDFDSDFYNHLINNDLDDQGILDYLIRFFLHKSNYITTHIGSVYIIKAEMLRMRYCYRDDLFHNRVIDKRGNFLLNFDKKVVSEELLRDAFKRTEDKNAFYETKILPFEVINKTICDFSLITN